MDDLARLLLSDKALDIIRQHWNSREIARSQESDAFIIQPIYKESSKQRVDINLVMER